MFLHLVWVVKYSYLAIDVILNMAMVGWAISSRRKPEIVPVKKGLFTPIPSYPGKSNEHCVFCQTVPLVCIVHINSINGSAKSFCTALFSQCFRHSTTTKLQEAWIIYRIKCAYLLTSRMSHYRECSAPAPVDRPKSPLAAKLAIDYYLLSRTSRNSAH